jgi:acyl-CoA synthetase (AMP-forming)/AMP-acid ligase II
MTMLTTSVEGSLSGSAPGFSLSELIHHRAAWLEDRPFVERARTDETLTFSGLGESVAGWRAECEAVGVAEGSVVGVAFTDPVVFATAFLSIMASGRWVAPLDPGLPGAGSGGMDAAIQRLGIRAVFSDMPRPEGVTCSWSAAEPKLSGAYGGNSDGHSQRVFGGALLASSGTTGAPKLIALPERQMLHAAHLVATHLDLTSRDRGFNSLPLFHVNAEVVGLLSSLVAGSSLVLDDRFHRSDFWNLMARRKITWINAVPAIISRLSRLQDGESVPPGVRFIRSASAPLPAEVMRGFERSIGIPVVETYGMTEAASQITANPLSGPRKAGSVGRPVGVDVRISHEADQAAKHGSRTLSLVSGHVEIRGPSVITEYGGGLHTDRFDAEGWLRTGDIGHFDQEGYLYLDGRSDDVINRGGEKVMPREIEELLLADPRVEAASVVGHPDPELGQVPVAYLVLSESGGPLNAELAHGILQETFQRLGASLVRAKRPESLRVVKELPTGATGKVQRRFLRDRSVSVLWQLDRP